MKIISAGKGTGNQGLKYYNLIGISTGRAFLAIWFDIKMSNRGLGFNS
jgi:hypothetical protein